MTKQQVLSQMILDKATDLGTARSLPITSQEVVRDAMDFVLGAGTYDRLVSDLYDDLRAKAA